MNVRARAKASLIATVAVLATTAAPAFDLPQSPVLSPNYDFRQFMDNNTAVMEQDRAETVRRIRDRDAAPSYEEMVKINALFQGKPVKTAPPKRTFRKP